jgi:hypothetical protein
MLDDDIKKAVEGYNLTLEKEILIENTAGVQADYFRHLEKNKIDILSQNEFAKNAMYLSRLQSAILMAESFDEVFALKDKISELKSLI